MYVYVCVCSCKQPNDYVTDSCYQTMAILHAKLAGQGDTNHTTKGLTPSPAVPLRSQRGGHAGSSTDRGSVCGERGLPTAGGRPRWRQWGRLETGPQAAPAATPSCCTPARREESPVCARGMNTKSFYWPLLGLQGDFPSHL